MWGYSSPILVNPTLTKPILLVRLETVIFIILYLFHNSQLSYIYINILAHILTCINIDVEYLFLRICPSQTSLWSSTFPAPETIYTIWSLDKTNVQTPNLRSTLPIIAFSYVNEPPCPYTTQPISGTFCHFGTTCQA